MARTRILIAGIIGNRPAVVYSTLSPLLAELSRSGQPSVLMAATSGRNGTENYYERLKRLSPLAYLHWLPPIIFTSDGWDSARNSLLDRFRDYDRVYLLLKGGMGIWLEKLVHALKEAAPTSTEYYFITSDGRYTILMDSKLQPLRQLRLASMGLAGFLNLNDMQAEGTEISGTLRNGMLRRGNAQVPFLMLSEHGGHLYTAIYAEPLLEEDHYQLAFRQYLGSCGQLGLERGRILLVIPNNKDKAYTLLKRASELCICAIFVNVDSKLEKVQSRDAVERRLRDMASTADPRDTTRISDVQPLPHITRRIEADYLSETLLMAVSGTDSYVNLLAFATHRPRRVILCYDRTSNDTILAAVRLQQRLMTDDDLFCEEALAVATDQMGFGLTRSLESVRQHYSCPWDINLTPGTKDQAFALLLSASKDDRLWVSDFRRRSMLGFYSEEQVLPWRYPALRHIAAHLGGPLQDCGVVLTRNMISDPAINMVRAVFSHLVAINFTSFLSAPGISGNFRNLRPVIDNNGVLLINETGEEFVLAELFPWFDFSDQDGKHDPNLWLEPFTALCLVVAGADEVVCNIKWSWNTGFSKSRFRDELDIVARFEETIVAISCKTNPGIGKRMEKNLWEIDYMAATFFGKFARPFLVCPMNINSSLSFNDREAEKLVSRTRLLGVNHLVQLDNLKKILLTST